MNMLSAIAPSTLKVYAAVATLLWKHGNREALKRMGITKLPGFSGKDEDEQADAEDLARDLEEMGPTFVKVGQLLSTQLDLLPPEYVRAMGRLHDEVAPFPFTEAVEIIESGIGEPIRSVFSHIEQVPIGSASLGQVYRATLLDGSDVAVKVQRPGVEKQVEHDFDAIRHVAAALDRLTEGKYGLSDLAEQCYKRLQDEMDYLAEASNLARLRDITRHHDLIMVPGVYRSLCAKRVIVMQFAEGVPTSSLTPRQVDEIDGPKLAESVFNCYLEQILVEGFFHADPHPGNVLIDPQGRCVLLDLGMVGRIAPRMRGRLMHLLLAMVDGRGEEVAEIAIELGEVTPEFERPAFIRDISDLLLKQHHRSIQGGLIGESFLEIASICAKHNLTVPPLISLIGKTLLNLDQLGQTLNPGFQPASQIKKYAGTIVWKDVWQMFNPYLFVGEAFELQRLARTLPRRVSQAIDIIAREDKGFRIDAIDEDRLIHGFEKIANRITHGLIIAALFLSSALIMNIENIGWRFAGIPLISWIMLIVASTWVTGIIGAMFWRDFQKSDRK